MDIFSLPPGRTSAFDQKQGEGRPVFGGAGQGLATSPAESSIGGSGHFGVSGDGDNAFRLTTPDTIFGVDPFAAKTGGDWHGLDQPGTTDHPASTDRTPVRRVVDEKPADVGSSIPLPPALPLLAAAILALVGFAYGLNRWVAPRDPTSS